MVAKKTPVKKRATRTKKKPDLETKLCSFKLICGDELVGYVDETLLGKDGLIVAFQPMRISIYAEQIILTPWGLSSEIPEIFTFPMEHIVSIYPVDEQMKIFHAVAQENYKFNKAYYDQLIYNSIQIYRRAQDRRNNLPEPDDIDLSDIENEVAKCQKQYSYSAVASVPDGVQTRSELIDSLVELAEKAGKGKNAKN